MTISQVLSLSTMQCSSPGNGLNSTSSDEEDARKLRLFDGMSVFEVNKMSHPEEKAASYAADLQNIRPDYYDEASSQAKSKKKKWRWSKKTNDDEETKMVVQATKTKMPHSAN